MEIAKDQVEADIRRGRVDGPRVPYADEIAIDAYGGAVTLRGTVGSFAQQRAAVADARRTRGVSDVCDALEVRLLNLDVDVGDGWVTLKGEVDHPDQSDAAFEHAASLYGVTGVTNEIKVVEEQ
jgi:osmotically-inducible protein OsmY